MAPLPPETRNKKFAPHTHRPAFLELSSKPNLPNYTFYETLNIMSFKKIAVLGASGLIGQPVVKQLANAGFDLTLISRDSSKLKSLFSNLSGAKFVQADSSDASALKEAFSGKDEYCMLELTWRN